ncbi:hypothetical protein BKH41_02690 [Helicobacter sp. 12S02232-10]|uniref:hypothetical protein n=1 Tax=Helicobacter sp. 12S02232-10 TaxID=1476197 RepID=UPI000BA58E33|nr:hypothetical protein [Helicobacter sp. 12S02232-10]PAF49590.1 hypothetical protein BKH41_02690 [Helicobacter sp. 12S02232-10]
MKQNKNKKETPISNTFEKKGMRLATWARAKGLSEEDVQIIRNMSFGQTKGKRGRAKELKELLIKENLWWGVA